MFLVRNHKSHGKVLRAFNNLRCYTKAAPYINTIIQENDEKLVDLIRENAPKIVYNSIIESKKLLRYNYRNNSIILNKLKRKEEHMRKELGRLRPLPLTLKYLDENFANVEQQPPQQTNNGTDNAPIHFPFKSSETIDSSFNPKTDRSDVDFVNKDVANEACEEVRQRSELKRELGNWMTAYDNYDDSGVVEEDGEDEEFDVIKRRVNYGTPDPHSKVSNVPCGGCGALLHCKDTSIPGYIPSEIFKNCMQKGGVNLQAIICQRCHFLKYYDLALQVRVSPEDYPKVLANINERRGLVVLLVDLLDFPCSIWPGLADIFGSKVPIVVVGNKVDLLPKDSDSFLDHIKQTLLTQVKLSGFATLNVQHVALISAKTGYGVEDLITRLNSFYRYKGNVYIVGCTNVGKSSLFNAFLQSDYCKVQAMDLIQRATTSIWPGTTLNLLKFPIKRPAGYRQYLRHKRLMQAQKVTAGENQWRREQLKTTRDPKYATLIGHIDITRNPYQKVEEKQDFFSIQGNSDASGKVRMGIDENKMEFAYSKWCYDTPGVVQPDQIVHLLTTEELMATLPKELILPRSFCLKPGMTLFIAGLSRLDYTEGPGSLKLTVFASNELPLTVCNVADADDLYDRLLGTQLFKTPAGNAERLSRWPKLELARTFSVEGKNWNESAIDVVLSSSGWVAVTGRAEHTYEFQAWTPEKRGVYLRDCVLPYAINLRGSRCRHSVAYERHKFYTK